MFPMPNWLIKSAIQHCISILPQRQRWNEFFQKFGTKSLELSEAMFEWRLNNCRDHLERLAEFRQAPMHNFKAVEIGTGWYPTIAIGLHLCGAGDVWAIDIDPLLSSSRLRRLATLFCKYGDEGKLEKFLPRLRQDRMKSFRAALPAAEQEFSAEAFLEQFRIHPLVLDARQTNLPRGCIDFCFSHGVLEYIPRRVLQGILGEFRRICSSEAVMSHWVTMVDQFSAFDRSITPFNFLKYSNRQWRFLESPLIPQNRLRVSDYRALFPEAGFEILRSPIRRVRRRTSRKFGWRRSSGGIPRRISWCWTRGS
jgi:hypothetical protein